MSRFQNQTAVSEIDRIKEFITSCGFEGVSDLSSNNKIYSKNGTVIVIREAICTLRDDVGEK